MRPIPRLTFPLTGANSTAEPAPENKGDRLAA
jgi:hypothetical protein